MGGMAKDRLASALWLANAAVSAGQSKIDTETAISPCLASTVAFSGVRASALTERLSPITAEITWPAPGALSAPRGAAGHRHGLEGGLPYVAFVTGVPARLGGDQC